jgi:hypothetical protein
LKISKPHVKGDNVVNTHTPHRSSLVVVQALSLFFVVATGTHSSPRRPPAVGRIAVIVDERLSALRAEPDLSAKLLQRVSRGRLVAIIGRRQATSGIVFYHVRLTVRTGGWIQKEAVVSPSNPADDQSLMLLIRSSESFDCLSRAQIFLRTFPRSSLRPEVLLIYADAAEQAAIKLSKDANRRLDQKEIAASRAPEFSFFLNYNGVDRYNRLGVGFVFDRAAKQFHYDGKAWREILKRYPNSAAAVEARQRLANLAAWTRQ